MIRPLLPPLTRLMVVACMVTACSQAAQMPSPATDTSEPSAVSAQTTPVPVALADTESWELVAAGNGRTYPVWISLPASYTQGTARKYPVVFVTDALYAFPLVRSIRNLLGQKGRNIEDFILVGLPPQKGLSSLHSRGRDYTPSNPLLEAGRDQHRYQADHYGEAAAYRDFIEHQVFPLVASHYRADMQRKVFAGHSYGGLFGSFMLLTKPEMFQNYILSSPSLQFNRDDIFKYEQSYADKRRDLPAKVMLYNGMYETVGPAPRFYKNTDMIGGTRRFEQALKSRRYPNLWIDSQVIPEEDHLSVFPDAISRGLLWALPGHGPYTSG
jgi:uncharacterized protein